MYYAQGTPENKKTVLLQLLNENFSRKSEVHDIINLYQTPLQCDSDHK